MSDEDRDVDIESDDDDVSLSSPSNSGLGKHGGQFPTQVADKRAHHNALERKRRDHIKDSFSGLRDALPSLQGEKASRAQILKKAAEYIQFMRRKNSAHQQDIDDLRRQNKILEEQIRSLEKTKSTGNFAASTVLENASHLNSKGDAISAFDGGSGSESSDTEEAKEGRRKRLKTSPGSTPVRT